LRREVAGAHTYFVEDGRGEQTPLWVHNDCGGNLRKVTTAHSRRFWKDVFEFQGSKVYQRHDLIDAKRIDARGRTNLERMGRGLAPIGPDGMPIVLHHMLQTGDGPLAEMLQTFHKRHASIIHINSNAIPSGIDRPTFEAWRQRYWRNRAKDFA